MEQAGTYVLHEGVIADALLREIPRARGVFSDLIITLHRLNSFAHEKRPELERAIEVIEQEIDEREAYWRDKERWSQ